MSHISPQCRLIITDRSIKLFHLQRFIRRQRPRIRHSWIDKASSLKASDGLVMLPLQGERITCGDPCLGARPVERHQVLGETGKFGPIVQVPEDG